jgi:hypothetical protein
MYLASIEWWFAAGMSLAIGAMFKGQLMMVAPVLALWPLFAGRWSAAARIVLGFLFAAALYASPWLARNRQAWEWIGSVLMLGLFLVLMGRRRRDGVRHDGVRPGRGIWPMWSAIFVIALVVRPGGLSHIPPLILGCAVALTPWLARHLTRRASVVWLATIVTAAIVISSLSFDGTWSWLSVGFEYPTRHHLNMGNGGACNLPVILGESYKWNIDDLVGHFWRWDITIKTLLVGIYACTLGLCAIGAAINDRRNDPRVLISLTAPWVLMFTLVPQMHERYLMWGAAVCGVSVASSFGLSLMHLVIIGLSVTFIGRNMLSQNSDFLPATARFFDGTYPGIGWMVSLAAAVYLVMAVVPRRRRRQLIVE